MNQTPSFRVAGTAFLSCVLTFFLGLLAWYLDSVLLQLVAVVLMVSGLVAGIWGVFLLPNRPS
jgi:hypothetical protein